MSGCTVLHSERTPMRDEQTRRILQVPSQPSSRVGWSQEQTAAACRTHPAIWEPTITDTGSACSTAPVPVQRSRRCTRRTARITCALMEAVSISEGVGCLGTVGIVRILGPFTRPDDAFSAARVIVDDAAATDARLELIGDFVVPPPDGPPSRDFQTLHLDFGLPLTPVVPADVARYTALHVPGDALPSDAVTRFVPLRSLLGGRPWPDRHELIRRFTTYGVSHGAWDDAAGYVEGSLARIVEAALGQTPVLRSVKAQSGFLCGTEFATLDDELRFFEQRGLRLDAIGTEVCVRPGELLVFDNLAVAHGRRGTRRPGELHQRIFGHRALPIEEQIELRNRVLAAFAS